MTRATVTGGRTAASVDEAFLYSESIDVTSYGRLRDKLREELTLAQIDTTASLVRYLEPGETANESLVNQTGIEPPCFEPPRFELSCFEPPGFEPACYTR